MNEQGTGKISLIDESGLFSGRRGQSIRRAIHAMSEPVGNDLHADVEVQLTKPIPLKSLASRAEATDAAAAFRAVRIQAAPQVSDRGSDGTGCPLGADIPTALPGGTRLEGIGKILTELPLMPDCAAVVLIKPKASASTAQAPSRSGYIGEYHHPDIDG